YTNCFITDTLVASGNDATDGALTAATNSATCMIQHSLAIRCPEPVSVQCYADVPPPDTNAVVVTSTAGGATVTHAGDSATTNGCVITITRVYRAVDRCENTATCTQLITVADTMAPMFAGCPQGPIALPCNAAPTCANALALVTVTDN